MPIQEVVVFIVYYDISFVWKLDFIYALDEILFLSVVKNMVKPKMCTLSAVAYGHVLTLRVGEDRLSAAIKVFFFF